MSTMAWIILAIAVIVVLAIAGFAWSMMRKRRTERLRGAFGSEYDREVSQKGRGKAESELESRKKRVEALNIHPLSGQQAAGYQKDWDRLQSEFVDNPSVAINEADDLVLQVMQVRGYPMGDFDQRIADISVDHANVATNYRMAHAIAVRNRRGDATTEDLRQAMVHYRSLFQELLEVQEAPASEARTAERGQPRPT